MQNMPLKREIAMKNQLNTEIGKRVRERREAMKYSREGFAEALKISSRFLADIELGTKGMSFPTLIKLCELLSTSPNYILLGKTEPTDVTEINRLVSNIDAQYLPLAEDLLRTFIKTIATAKQEG